MGETEDQEQARYFMEALRAIVRSHTKYYRMTLPEWAVGRDIEVIVLPVAIPDDRQEKTRSDHTDNMGPLSVLGYAKTFRTTKTTEEWMQELRAGESA